MSSLAANPRASNPRQGQVSTCDQTGTCCWTQVPQLAIQSNPSVSPRHGHNLHLDLSTRVLTSVGRESVHHRLMSSQVGTRAGRWPVRGNHRASNPRQGQVSTSNRTGTLMDTSLSARDMEQPLPLASTRTKLRLDYACTHVVHMDSHHRACTHKHNPCSQPTMATTGALAAEPDGHMSLSMRHGATPPSRLDMD